MSVEDAAGVANATAGQSVLFAGMTVVIAITGLVMAGLPAITAMGFAAAIVVLFSMVIAVTLLPACLGLAGRHIDRWAIPHRKDRGGEGAPDVLRPVGPSRRQAPVALRDPQPRRLLAARHPCGRARRWGSADDSNTAADTTEHKAYDLLTDGFGQGFNGPLMIVVDLTDSGDPAALDRDQRSGRCRRRHRRRPAAAAQRRAATRQCIMAQPTTSPQDTATDDTVQRLRSDVLPPTVGRRPAPT